MASGELMPEFMDRVMPVVDETIQAIEDPIGGAKGANCSSCPKSSFKIRMTLS